MSSYNTKNESTLFTFSKIGVTCIAAGITVIAISLSQFLVKWAAVLVWIFGLLALFWYAAYLRMLFDRAKARLKKKKVRYVRQNAGIMSFCTNTVGTAADILMFVCIIAIILTMINQYQTVLIMSGIRGLFLTAFLAHCFFNGIVYNSCKKEAYL